MVQFTVWPESDTLTERRAQKCLRMLNLSFCRVYDGNTCEFIIDLDINIYINVI